MAATRGCPFRCQCHDHVDNNNRGLRRHHICSAGTCSCYATDSHICGCSAMSCRRPGVTTPYNYVEIRKGYVYHGDRPEKSGASNSHSSDPRSEMMAYANLNAWLRRLSVMLQKEEEMRAPPTSFDQILLEANVDGASAANDSLRRRRRPSSATSAAATPPPPPSLLLLHRHDPPLTDRRKFLISYRHLNCPLHLVRIVEISRSSAACRLVEDHVHRRLTRHMLRHIVTVGRALPDDTDKSLYLEELLPTTSESVHVHRRRQQGGDKDGAAIAWRQKASGVEFPKRLKDATYADLLRISKARLKNNSKQIAAKAAADMEEKKGSWLVGKGKGESKFVGGRKSPIAVAAAALAKSAFVDMLVSTSSTNRPSTDVMDALEAAELGLQEDASQSGFTLPLVDVRAQMSLHFDLLPNCLRPSDARDQLGEDLIRDIDDAAHNGKLPPALQPMQQIVELACFFAFNKPVKSLKPVLSSQHKHST